MKKLTVKNHKDYAHFEYTPYFDRNTNPIPRPKNTKYDLGDVVYIKPENSIGVVIGCIDNECGELRTDMDGMQAFSQIEPATKAHFEIKDVHFVDRLKDELFGVKKEKKVVYTSDGKYEVKCGNIVIAKSYMASDSSPRHYEVRILQGMDRDATIKKICEDCPEFAKSNDITENYYPYLFGAPKKTKKK